MIDQWGQLSYDKQEPTQNITHWIFDADSFVPTAKIKDAKTYSIVSDYLGSPHEMYDEAGKKVWEAVLDIYGRVRTLSGDKSSLPFRYQGQYEDVETGLYYNRFRYYSSEEGMYISQDPIGLFGGRNLYSYVKDSNSTIDVFGLDWNYHLTDANSNVYYHGRASDNATMADVANRHTGTVDSDGARFGAGDKMTRTTPVGTSYDTVRGVEQRGVSENPLLGRGSDNVRGNKINGISEAKQNTLEGQRRLGRGDNILNGRKASEMPSLEELQHGGGKGCH